MNNKKQKLGLVFFAAKWFKEVVLGEDDVAQEFNKSMADDTAKIINKFSEDFEVINYPVVTSMEKAHQTSKDLLTEDIDCLLLCFIVWSEDEYLLAFKDIMKIKPSILWAYTPYTKAPLRSDITAIFRNSGIIGTFEGFGVIKKMDINPFYIFGSLTEKEPFDKIKKIVRAAKIYKDLKTIKLGVLPYRNNQMIVTYVDEFRLYSQIGPVVDYISVLQLKKAADSVPENIIKQYVKELKDKFKIDSRVTGKNLFSSAKASLGMQVIMEEKNIDGLALSDLNPELHEVMGLRPCLYPEALARSDRVVGNEGDLGCTTAMHILQRLTGNPVMFTEIFNYDRQDNTIVTGHAGPSNYLLAENDNKVNITPDFELMNATSDISGVWMEFIGKPGRVTLLNLICTVDSFQVTILGGESLSGNIRLDGYPHYYIKIDPDMTEFLKSCATNGISHHWAVVNGDVGEELSYLADILKIKKVIFN